MSVIPSNYLNVIKSYILTCSQTKIIQQMLDKAFLDCNARLKIIIIYFLCIYLGKNRQ